MGFLPETEIRKYMKEEIKLPECIHNLMYATFGGDIFNLNEVTRKSW